LLRVKAADVGNCGDIELQIAALRILLFLDTSAASRLLVGSAGGCVMAAVDLENSESVQWTVEYLRVLMLEYLTVGMRNGVETLQWRTRTKEKGEL
jgi:hypothetical protein